jgi:ketopantoate reductase
MRLLIFGAGVLGTFYAVKLLARGHDVTVLCSRSPRCTASR